MSDCFEAQEFCDFQDRESARVFADLEFRRCRFAGSFISVTRYPWFRSTVRNVRLIRCVASVCTVYAAIVEDVLVDTLSVEGTFFTRGAVFKHVTLKGKIGPLLIDPLVSPGSAEPGQQEAFDEANRAYYESVDWALDISEAEFVDVGINGVPARLIRRDPLTQVVVTREKALEGRWRQLDLSKTIWPSHLKLFLNGGEPDVVLAASKADKRTYQYELDGLKMLRDAGVAEPD